MSAMRCAIVLLPTVVHLLEGAVLSTPLHRISPELEPKSDKVFFKKDYPSDLMPRAGKRFTFDHPYPAVQDNSDFDADFVKDENSDKGHWKTQMDYDILRTKIREAEKRLAEAKAELEKHDEAWKKASVDYTEVAQAEEVTEAEMKKLEADAAKADAKVEKLEGAASAHGDAKVGGAVGQAVGDVNKEMTDLEDCKKNLAEAKERLKKLLKEKEELEHQEKLAQADADKLAKAKADETAKQEMTDKLKRAEDAEIRDNEKELAEQEVEARTQAESSWKKKLSQEQNQTSAAARSYEEELAEVKRTEAELKQAADNLRKYRRPPHVDDDGGVYYKKSAAVLSTLSPVLLLLTTAALAA